jgi:demethylmenaquinone methyltransferase/2-methoxy-6-polyprenyl-1,4-benzoquinol methylase
VPRLGAWLSGAREYRYLASSIEAFPPPEEVVAMIAAAGWRDAGFTAMAFDAAHLYVATA